MIYIKNFENFHLFENESFASFKIIKYYKNNLNEKLLENNNISFYDFNISGKIKNEPLDYYKIEKLKRIKEKVDNRLNEINNFQGIYKNDHGHVIKRFFNIKYSGHWLRKFLRKDMEDPDGLRGLKEPHVYEGIDLIYNNKNILTKYLSTNIIKDGYRVLVLAKTKEGYNLIFDIDKSPINKKLYNIMFISQMKGIGHNYNFNPNKKVINRKIKLDI